MLKTRQIFSELLKELDNNKILLLIGPRQVGKTTLLKQLQETIKDRKTFFVDLERIKDRLLLDEDPENIFGLAKTNSDEKQVIFVDEVQYLKNPSNFLKLLYDEYNQNLKLVISGSSSFYIDQKFKDSLMGRKELYEILTLNFEEFLDFKDELELKKYLFEEKKLPLGSSRKKLDNLFLEYITYGGYPEIVLTNDIEKKERRLGLLADDYIKKDIYDSRIPGIDKFFGVLKILASQVGELINMREIANSLQIDAKTVEKYIYIMRKSYTISLIKPFWTNLRAELTKMPKVFFFDLGLRNAVLNNFENINDRFDKGQYFENIVWREFAFKYNLFDDIKYWRNKDKNEVDLVIKGKKAVEVKFSKNLIKDSKYKVFKEKYPEIPLEFLTFNDIFEKLLFKL